MKIVFIYKSASKVTVTQYKQFTLNLISMEILSSLLKLKAAQCWHNACLTGTVIAFKPAGGSRNSVPDTAAATAADSTNSSPAVLSAKSTAATAR